MALSILLIMIVGVGAFVVVPADVGRCGRLARIATIGGPVLTLFSLSAACAQTGGPELDVEIGMPVAEFVAQDAARRMGIDLAVDDSDFWGTDDPVTLNVHLPNGIVRIELENRHLGMFVSSSFYSMNGSRDEVSRIRSLYAPVLGGSVSVVEDLDDVVTLCHELADRLGPDFSLDAERSADLRDLPSWIEQESLNACVYRGPGRSVSIGLRRTEGGDRYFSRFNLSEDIDQEIGLGPVL